MARADRLETHPSATPPSLTAPGPRPTRPARPQYMHDVTPGVGTIGYLPLLQWIRGHVREQHAPPYDGWECCVCTGNADGFQRAWEALLDPGETPRGSGRRPVAQQLAAGPRAHPQFSGSHAYCMESESPLTSIVSEVRVRLCE